jgi:putative flippase GtrA
MPADKASGAGFRAKLSERLRLMRFGIIGLTAAAIHYWAVVALVELAGVAPLHANVGGFAIAFWCSYFGHRHWTFADRHGIQAVRSFFRFLATALLGFALNQYLFYLLLTYLRLPYFVALAMVVFIVAVMTYLLSRIWAFRAKETL